MTAAAAAVPDRLRPAMTWRDLLIAITEELRHAPPAALDEVVLVQIPGRTTTLQSAIFDADDPGHLHLNPWLV